MTASLLARLFFAHRPDRELAEPTLQAVLGRERAVVAEFARRVPHIPLLQHRSGQDDSVLRSACFADLEAGPRRLIATDNPAVHYVELSFRYRLPGGVVRELNLGRKRLYARIEDPLYLQKRSHSVEHVRNQDALRQDYFRKVFTLIHAQSECNRELAGWMSGFLMPETEGHERDFLGAIQNFDHNIDVVDRQDSADRELFRSAVRDFDFHRQAPSAGAVSLRMSVRPHQRPDGGHGQSVTSILLGSSRGLAFRKPNGRVIFIPAGNGFEKRYRKYIERLAGERLTAIARNAYRKTSEERIWGAQGECAAYFHHNDTFTMKGLEWTLERDDNQEPRMMGTHRNVAAYASGRQRVAVKAVPFESVGDLVRLIQAHQYVHGVQASALLAQARVHARIGNEIMTTVASLLSERDNVRFEDAEQAWQSLGEDHSHRFARSIGPLLHQVTVDYDHKLLLAVLDWSAEGMLSEFGARKRLLEECSLSHRLRMAANLFRNGHQLLEDDVTHTDLKPENLLNWPNGAYHAQRKARREGWHRLDAAEHDALGAGESMLEGDFSGMHFGREGGVDNLAPGEGLPTSIHYSSWKFTTLGLNEGTQPTVLRGRRGDLPRLDRLVLEQDVANRGTTAWEIVYGSLVDCIPPAEKARRIEARRVTERLVEKYLDQAIRLSRQGEQDPEVMCALNIAVQECDRRLVDLVSLRSETIAHKTRLSPLFQHALDNRHGETVWLDPRVIDMLDHLACDFRRSDVTRTHVAKLYRTAEALLRAEAGRLEAADHRTAANRRLKMVAYMNRHRLHINPDCGLLGLPDLPGQLERIATMVNEMADPRDALGRFGETWRHVRQWGGTAFDALVELHAEQERAESGKDRGSGRGELLELVQSTLRAEHDERVRLESRVGEAMMQPPFLGLLERRRVVVHTDGETVTFSHLRDGRGVAD